VLALDDRQDLAVGRERPDIRLPVVVLLREAPVPRGPGGRVAADAGRIVERVARELRVSARADRVPRLLDRAHVRETTAEHAEVEHLLGDPLVHLTAVRRDAAAPR